MITKPLMAQQYTISGHVKDSTNGEALIGANIYEGNLQKGTSSNTYGFYSITLPEDTVTLSFSYTGYNSKITRFHLNKDTTININLTTRTMDEIVVRGNREGEIQETSQMSAMSVPINQIQSLPAFLGEVDIMKVMQLLPGVQSGNEGTSGLYVRGGGPDQNLILLDGVPVYNASHLFGFFSVFNADAINNVELIKGGFPARYGGRLSSVVDISMKEGNMKKFEGTGSVGLVASKLTLEGPIQKDKASFILSGRRTYIDFLARPLIKAAGNGVTSGYYFYDLNGKVNYRFSDKDRLYLSAYTGDDRAYSNNEDFYVEDNARTEYRNDYGLNWGNITSALRWNHVFNNKLFSNLTLTYSRYRFNIQAESEETVTTPNETTSTFSNNQYLSGINDLAARLDFDYMPSPDHAIKFGGHAIHHTFKPGAFSINSSNEIDTTFGSTNTPAIEVAAYAEDDIQWTDRLKTNFGLHLSGFYVNDEWYHSIQPRLSLRYLLNEDLSLKASYASMQQYIHLLTNAGIGLPTDLWVPATDQVKPQNSGQVALGAAWNLPADFEISLEGYYKSMDNLISYKEGASFVNNATGEWEDQVVAGSGKSYGGELLVQKKEGRTTGWVGYTLSKTQRQFEALNFGEPFPYKYDRRHDIGIALVHDFNKKIDFSMSWVYGTGNAVTLPVATYEAISRNERNNFYGNRLEYFESRNGYRMQPFHRLDISVSFSKEKKWGTRTWTVGAYNAYNRKNPFFMDIGRDDNGNQKFIQYTLFPIIPSVTFSFDF